MPLQYDVISAMRVCKNPYQGDYKRVLLVCSAGILRSATAAVVLSQPPYNFNTRSAGVEHYALIPVTEPLLEWADEIVCMTWQHQEMLKAMTSKKIHCLHIPDDYSYRHPELIKLIKERYDALNIAPVDNFTRSGSLP